MVQLICDLLDGKKSDVKSTLGSPARFFLKMQSFFLWESATAAAIKMRIRFDVCGSSISKVQTRYHCTSCFDFDLVFLRT